MLALARRLLWAAASGAGWVGMGCSAPPVEKPPAPDMAELVAVYDTPDAAFESGDASEIALAIALIDELLERTELRERLVDLLAAVLREATELSGGEDEMFDLDFDAGGYMIVTRICSGWTLPARPDRDANGAILVTATFSQDGLDPIVWGSAQACRYRVGDALIELDQVAASAKAVSVYWGKAPSELDVSERTLLVDLNLEAAIDSERLALDIDFRSLEDGTLEYRIPRPGGSIIARVGAADRVTLRASNGTFDCDAELSCGEARASEAP